MHAGTPVITLMSWRGWSCSILFTIEQVTEFRDKYGTDKQVFIARDKDGEQLVFIETQISSDSSKKNSRNVKR